MVLFTGAVVLILALFAIRLSDKYGIPSLLLFILLGMVFSYMGLEFADFKLAENIATAALIVIMFYGGFGTNWTMGKPVVKEAATLASLGVVATALLTGLFCYLVLGFNLMEGMLLGSIVGSTDYASVSNVLTSKNLNLKYNTAPLLEIESGSNDPTAYTMTMICLSILVGSDLSVPLLVAKQVLFGLGFGFLAGYVVEQVVTRVNFGTEGLATVFMAASALMVYSGTGLLDGNGYLAVYIFGIYIGNKAFPGKRDVVFFFDGLTQIMQIGLFFLLGVIADAGAALKVLPISLALMVFMTLIARPAAVFGLMAPFGLQKNQKTVISFAGLRGAAAIAFAIMAVNSGANFDIDIYHIVFGICLISSLIQGSLMPLVCKKTDMLDPNDTVLKTFNYYQDKSEVGFLQTTIQPDSELIGTKVKDLNLTFDFIVAKITRGQETIVPRGETFLEAGDLVVLGGETYHDPVNRDLVEIVINPKHPWANKEIQDLKLDKNLLILMMMDEERNIVVPRGDRMIKPGYTVIYIKEEDEVFTDADRLRSLEHKRMEAEAKEKHERIQD